MRRRRLFEMLRMVEYLLVAGWIVYKVWRLHPGSSVIARQQTGKALAGLGERRVDGIVWGLFPLHGEDESSMFSC
jgi:hypothetical protein